MRSSVLTAIYFSACAVISCNKAPQGPEERIYEGDIFIYTSNADLSEERDTVTGRATVRMERDSIFFLPENAAFLTPYRCLISDSSGLNNTYYIQGNGTTFYRFTADELQYRSELSYPTTPVKKVIEFRGR